MKFGTGTNLNMQNLLNALNACRICILLIVVDIMYIYFVDFSLEVPFLVKGASTRNLRHVKWILAVKGVGEGEV